MVGQTPQRFSGRCLTHARRGAHAGSDTSAFFGGMSGPRQTRRERGGFGQPGVRDPYEHLVVIVFGKYPNVNLGINERS